MKKIITAVAILFSIQVSAQPGTLDTVTVKNFPLKFMEAAFYASYLKDSKDSADIALLLQMRNAVRAVKELTWNSNITLDLPGRFVVQIYQISKGINAAVASQIGATAAGSIRAITHPVVSYWVGAIDQQFGQEFSQRVSAGRQLLID